MVGVVLKSVSRRSLLTLAVIVFAMNRAVIGYGEVNMEIWLGIWAYECSFDEYSMLLQMIRFVGIGSADGKPKAWYLFIIPFYALTLHTG
jgi:hypothetical protein